MLQKQAANYQCLMEILRHSQVRCFSGVRGGRPVEAQHLLGGVPCAGGALKFAASSATVVRASAVRADPPRRRKRTQVAIVARTLQPLLDSRRAPR